MFLTKVIYKWYEISSVGKVFYSKRILLKNKQNHKLFPKGTLSSGSHSSSSILESTVTREIVLLYYSVEVLKTPGVSCEK